MLFYPAALPLSRQTLDYTAGIIRHRKQIGSPWRKLNPGRQGLLVLAYLRKGRHSLSWRPGPASVSPPPGDTSPRPWHCLAAQSAGIQIARAHPHMLRHTYITTMLDAGADLRDVQIAARHADPRTTMRYDRARNNLDRHPNYILAAYMASGT